MEHLCVRSPHAHQPGNPPPARPPDGQRPAPHRVDELDAAVDARDAGALLWRRDRYGRQRIPWRSRRRANPDAVVSGPQRRFLARRSAAHLPAGADGPGLRLPGGQRRVAAGQSRLAAELDAPPDLGAARLSGVRPWWPALPLSRQSEGTVLSARVRRPDTAVRGQPVASCAAGRTRPGRVPQPGTDRAGEPQSVSPDRRATLSADAAGTRLLLVPAGDRGCRATLARQPARTHARPHHTRDPRRMAAAARWQSTARPREDRAASVRGRATLVRPQGPAHRGAAHRARAGLRPERREAALCGIAPGAFRSRGCAILAAARGGMGRRERAERRTAAAVHAGPRTQGGAHGLAGRCHGHGALRAPGAAGDAQGRHRRRRQVALLRYPGDDRAATAR